MRHSRWMALGGIGIAATLALAGCGGSGFDDGPAASGEPTDAGGLTSSDDALTIMIGSSGDAETTAVKDAVAAWSEESGVDAEVVAATDLTQQLSQGFAGGNPPDLFYLATELLAGYADNGSVIAYGDMLENKDDFYPSLVQNFTYNDQFYCAPKDFSTLQLIINKNLWDQAGLTDADVPTDWDSLAAAAKKLTSGDTTGLVFSGEYQRVGAFMAEAGGRLVSEDGTSAVADSQENIDALTYVKEHLADGTFAYAADVGAGWGGEAFGKQLGAMTIEGNWITGALGDYPDVDPLVVELPAGPAGKGTLQFTNCWGMAADSPNQQAALDLVEYLTSADQQLAFSKAFGPMPSVQSAADQWTTDNPDLAAFLAGADYAQGVPTNDGVSDVFTDFNAQLATLKDGDPATILQSVQSNLEAIVG
ncbi:extracellular solute-binding protein [Microbacterium sp. KSW4-11]|uniref:Sugar ABC transporter substrate-binding protein n=2 Tax=Microbacterium TaxID=33882 RepID=A0A177KDD4_9MICO|nr:MULTISPECIES: extracellular solute-binding protein [Microbacterium]MDT3317604.1 extracellular solute-binding protein [Microbacterium sp. KSW4-11]OAH51144.1 sugar ABC transporter substrate-binding protein [Microbacterium oleivorans]